MGSFKQPQVFLPLDLEIMDRVYEAAWAELEARDPFRDRDKDGERGETLRKLVMDQTSRGKVDFDTLLARVVANMPETWVVFARPGSSGFVGA
jgi:hypothetical protein